MIPFLGLLSAACRGPIPVTSLLTSLLKILCALLKVIAVEAFLTKLELAHQERCLATGTYSSVQCSDLIYRCTWYGTAWWVSISKEHIRAGLKKRSELLICSFVYEFDAYQVRHILLSVHVRTFRIRLPLVQLESL